MGHLRALVLVVIAAMAVSAAAEAAPIPPAKTVSVGFVVGRFGDPEGRGLPAARISFEYLCVACPNHDNGTWVWLADRLTDAEGIAGFNFTAGFSPFDVRFTVTKDGFAPHSDTVTVVPANDDSPFVFVNLRPEGPRIPDWAFHSAFVAIPVGLVALWGVVVARNRAKEKKEKRHRNR